MRVYHYQLCGVVRGRIHSHHAKINLDCDWHNWPINADLDSHHRCIIRRLGGNAFHSFLNSHIQIPYTPLIVDIGP